MLLEFDLAGAEWFVTGFVANIPAMIEVFRAGKSPHPVTAARITGLDEATIIADDKLLKEIGDPEEIAAVRREKLPQVLRASWYPRTMSIRQAAKKANHGLNYRLGYRTFALKNEMQESEAKRIVELYRGDPRQPRTRDRAAYPGLLDWYERIDQTIRDTRTLTNCFGRKVYFSGGLNDETFREATAFVPQSTVFDITARAMPLMLNDDSPDFRLAELLAQVHDSLLTQHRSRDFRSMARFAIRLGLDYMSPTLSYNGMDFTLGVGCKAGVDWGSLTEIPLTRDESAMAMELERVFEKSMSRKAAA